MLTYLSVDETLVICCIVSGLIGFLLGMIANGLRKGPLGETYIYTTPFDAWEDRRSFPWRRQKPLPKGDAL